MTFIAPARIRIRERAKELLKRYDRDTVIDMIEKESGIRLAPQAVGYWASRARAQSQGRRQVEEKELSEGQLAAITEAHRRTRADIAAKPHRCPTCRGVTVAPKCEWCGGMV